MDMETLVEKAQNGNAKALEQLVIDIQDDIYYLCIRMHANPEIARESCQEVLIKVITNLGQFRGESRFKTWVFRIASNYLYTRLAKDSRDPIVSFDDFKEDLESDLAEPSPYLNDPSYPLILNEVRIGCTMGMLLCLDNKHRMAYILGEIFELDHKEGSYILGIKEDTYRKQLSRSRIKIEKFMNSSCGLVNKCNKCSCAKKITGAIKRKRVSPLVQHLADQSTESFDVLVEKIEQTQQHLKSSKIQSYIPRFKSPEDFGLMIEKIIFK